MAIMKYDYCLLSRIAAARLTSDRFISWHVTRVIFEYCPDLSLVLTRKRQERSLPPTTTGRSSSSMDSQERERARPSRRAAINIQEGANKEHRPSKKRVIRPCEESWKSDLCYGKVWLPMESVGGLRVSFHDTLNSSVAENPSQNLITFFGKSSH